MNVTTIDRAIEMAWDAMDSDPAIDSIVYRVESDARFPVPGNPPVSYAAFYRGPESPVLYGVYASDEVASMHLRNRRAMGRRPGSLGPFGY